MRPLRPVKITDETMEHIHSHAGRGHITKRDIREAIQNKMSMVPDKKSSEGDYLVHGKSYNGVKLVICVKLLRDEEQFLSEVLTAWCQ